MEDKDVIINCLGSNPTTKGLLDKDFFNSLKKGSYFITVTGKGIYDIDALITALDNGILTGAATDAANIQTGDVNNEFYQKLLNHPKILVTPHIAYCAESTARNCNDMMIDNIEAWLKGKPINIVK